MWKQAGRFMAVGLEMGIAVAIGFFGGKMLDSYFGVEPVFRWLGIVFGVGAAGKAIYDAARLTRNELTDNGRARDKKD